MEKRLGEKLKKLREVHFPGESLRSVSEKLNLGINFFTHLSKIESGAMLPSENLLENLGRAYGLSKEEYTDLIAYFHTEKLNKTLMRSNVISKGHEVPVESVREFFRKIKKQR